MLLVHCHPRADSLSTALRDTARQALAGHEVPERDLHAGAFNPAQAMPITRTPPRTSSARSFTMRCEQSIVVW
ncbi:MAG: hypothetical protein H7345_08755 [Rubritepida sp.]|nr:hypothetical protein [Rubritepida sp.]